MPQAKALLMLRDFLASRGKRGNHFSVPKKDESTADACPHCGYQPSYQGGHCFKCGKFRPSKKSPTFDREGLDATEFMTRSFGIKMSSLDESEESHNEKILLKEKSRKGRVKTAAFKPHVFEIERQNEASLLIQSVVEPVGKTSEGELVRAVEIPWLAIIDHLKKDWTQAFKIEPRLWEQIIAAAFDKAGYDEVTLTPRSGDYGRDVIAVKKGVGTVRIIDSVKAYKPGHLVKHDDVRALAGVLHGDHKASKGIITTTSDFAPRISEDPFLKPLMPFRLELMNGARLREWLESLTKR